MVNEIFFNASISTTGEANKINRDGIKHTQVALDNQRELLLSSEPPVVKIMHNLNGEVILGDLGPDKTLLYDSEDMILAEAIMAANPKKDIENVYLQVGNTEVLIPSRITNIYTLNLEGKVRYFKTHSALHTYLKEQLLLITKRFNVKK